MNSEVFVWQFDTRTPLSLLTPLALTYIYFPKVPCEEFAGPGGERKLPDESAGGAAGAGLSRCEQMASLRLGGSD